MLFWNLFLNFSAVFALVCGTHFEKLDKLARKKRTLLFGETTVLQLIIGYGTPVPDLLAPSTNLGFFLRAVYGLPKNATDYTSPEIAVLTRSMPFSRWDLYRAMEKDSELRGLGGRPCILRSICEAADIPLDHDHGFFEEVFHIIFTPTSTNEDLIEHSDNEYLAAYHLGQKNPGKCKEIFPQCKLTFLDLFTQLYRSYSND